MPEQKQLRAVIYGRVSTDRQDVDSQLVELPAYIERRGWILTEQYLDTGTGLVSKQPRLRDLLDDAWKRKFDAVVTWGLDRMGRDFREIVDHVDDLSKRGVTVICYHQRWEIDLTSYEGKLRLSMLAWMADYERAQHSERIRIGIRAARAAGKHIGRQALPLNEDKIRADYEKLKSLRAVARLHHCSKWTVAEILKERRRISVQPGEFPVQSKSPAEKTEKSPAAKTAKQST